MNALPYSFCAEFQPSLASLFNLAGPDLIIILVIVLLLFGAKKLPELARGLGQAVKEFSKAKDEFEREVSQPMGPASQGRISDSHYHDPHHGSHGSHGSHGGYQEPRTEEPAPENVHENVPAAGSVSGSVAQSAKVAPAAGPVKDGGDAEAKL
jgi:sec-independent protein translocase protein TatA